VNPAPVKGDGFETLSPLYRLPGFVDISCYPTLCHNCYTGVRSSKMFAVD